jgi:hypothetical protein
MKILIALVLLSSIAVAQDKSFWITTAVQAAVTARDGYETSICGCTEVGTPWLYGREPFHNKTRFALTLGGEFTTVALSGYVMKHSRMFRHVWWAPQSAVIGTHTDALVYNHFHKIK